MTTINLSRPATTRDVLRAVWRVDLPTRAQELCDTCADPIGNAGFRVCDRCWSPPFVPPIDVPGEQPPTVPALPATTVKQVQRRLAAMRRQPGRKDRRR